MVVSDPLEARQPHNPISRRQIETVVSRSVAVFGLTFGAQAIPVMLGQVSQLDTFWFYTMAIAIFGGVFASIIASFARRLVRFAYGYIAIAFLLSLVVWPFAARDTSAVATDRPWLWLLCTVGTSAAAVAFNTWVATAYLIVAPLV